MDQDPPYANCETSAIIWAHAQPHDISPKMPQDVPDAIDRNVVYSYLQAKNEVKSAQVVKSREKANSQKSGDMSWLTLRKAVEFHTSIGTIDSEHLIA